MSSPTLSGLNEVGAGFSAGCWYDFSACSWAAAGCSRCRTGSSSEKAAVCCLTMGRWSSDSTGCTFAPAFLRQSSGLEKPDLSTCTTSRASLLRSTHTDLSTINFGVYYLFSAAELGIWGGISWGRRIFYLPGSSLMARCMVTSQTSLSGGGSTLAPMGCRSSAMSHQP